MDERQQPKAKRATSLKKRLVVSLGDKGGVGKSFLIRKLAGMHLEAQMPNLLLVDGDASVSSIYKFHQETVVPFNLARHRRRTRPIRERIAAPRQGPR